MTICQTAPHWPNAEAQFPLYLVFKVPTVGGGAEAVNADEPVRGDEMKYPSSFQARDLLQLMQPCG